MTSRAVRAVLIVPANNTTMEPEIRAYCPDIEELRVARVPRPPRPLQVGDLPEYRKSTLQTVLPLVGGGVDLRRHHDRTARQLPTIDIIRGLSEQLARPVWSSVKAAGWQASETLKRSAGRSSAAA